VIGGSAARRPAPARLPGELRLPSRSREPMLATPTGAGRAERTLSRPGRAQPVLPERREPVALLGTESAQRWQPGATATSSKPGGQRRPLLGRIDRAGSGGCDYGRGACERRERAAPDFARRSKKNGPRCWRPFEALSTRSVARANRSAVPGR